MTEDCRSNLYGWTVSLATLGPVGKCPVAPGTAGSLAGFAAYLFAGSVWQPAEYVYWIFCAILPLLAVPICHAAEEIIGRKDPPEIVLDEFAVVPLCFLGTINPSEITSTNSPKIFVWFLGGFVLFRFFDVLKPLGIRASQRLPKGWGVVLDDALAALCVCACLNVGWRLMGMGEFFFPTPANVLN